MGGAALPRQLDTEKVFSKSPRAPQRRGNGSHNLIVDLKKVLEVTRVNNTCSMFRKKVHALDKQSASSCPSSAPNSPRPTPALPSESAPRTRTRLPCTPALAPSNRISGRARSPRTSPPARAMGRQRARPSPCPATQGTAPPTSAPTRALIPRAGTAGATPCHPYRVSLLPITRRLPSPPHRSEHGSSTHRCRGGPRDG